MQAQALYNLENVEVPWYCGQPGQLKCLQKGKLLKVLRRAKLRFSSPRQMSQLCQTRKLLYVCCFCYPVCQQPCKVLTAILRICDVKLCIMWYCVSHLAGWLYYQLCTIAALLPVFSHLRRAAFAMQKVPTQLLLSVPLQDEAPAVQARLPRCRYGLQGQPLLVEQSIADKPHCAETAVLLSLPSIQL